MSFMFYPSPFKDERAVNPVEEGSWAGEMTQGALALARRLGQAVRGGIRRIGLDGYAGAELLRIKDVLVQHMGPVNVLSMADLWKSPEEIREVIAPSLPMDRAMDPVLLYGVRLERTYEELLDPEKLAHAQAVLQGEGVVLVVGQGSLCDALRPLYDLRLWADITPRQAAVNYRMGCAHNLGEKDALPFGQMMRRNYYVDFELAVHLRWKLILCKEMDWYLAADDPDQPTMLPFSALCELFDALGTKPLRCRPVYLEGVWGGYYMKRLRNLPEDMKNCAWIFDMIPMEVSLAAQIGEREVEVPFFTYIQQQGEKLLGSHAFSAFGGYFPLRFNYDDTFHSSGNMSIQCHPGEAYLRQTHGELGRQDESYYVCVAGEGAKTYLGFRGEGDCQAFLAAAKASQAAGKPMDYEQYLHAVPSVPGTQMMIPAGTIHASGHNQVILEIGSLTMGSYTYKLYDYLRTDPNTGMPRPIHLEAGEEALVPERTAPWVMANLVNCGRPVRTGDGGREVILGEHELLYFSLRSLRFEKEMADDTQGTFHVLALTEGECLLVQSLKRPERFFRAHYLDMLVVPADFGPYALINEGAGMVTVHKTMLKAKNAHG